MFVKVQGSLTADTGIGGRWELEISAFTHRGLLRKAARLMKEADGKSARWLYDQGWKSLDFVILPEVNDG